MPDCWNSNKSKAFTFKVAICDLEALVVAPHNVQVNLLTRALRPGARVGTVDKLHGQAAEVVIMWTTTSSGEYILRPCAQYPALERSSMKSRTGMKKSLLLDVLASRLIRDLVMRAGIAAKNAERIAAGPYGALITRGLVGICYSMQFQQPHFREPAFDGGRILQSLRLLKSDDV